MSAIKNMIEDALEIKDYCDSEFCSDWEASIKSENFKQQYGRNWTEVIDDYYSNTVIDPLYS